MKLNPILSMSSVGHFAEHTMRNLSLILLLLISSLASAQNILRVNNNVGVNAPYTTISAAIAAAGVNDIIMVEGSTVAYDNITVNKKVTIKGPGYLLLENLNLQGSPSSASLATVTFAPGSDGSSLNGLNITGGIGTADNAITNNITVSNCRIGNLTLSGDSNNFFLSGCYIVTNLIFTNVSEYTGAIISNNYISGFGQGSLTTLVTLTHNVIAGSISTSYNCDFYNNILIGQNSSSRYYNSTIKNNVFTVTQATLAGAGSPVDGTNIFSALTTDLFIGLSGNTTDTQWRLKTGSPAIGVGIGGVDCGIYGGNVPYRPSGIQVGQPTINSFTTPASVQQNGTLNVKVSAKVN
jgi:hypothetical protein